MNIIGAYKSWKSVTVEECFNIELKDGPTDNSMIGVMRKHPEWKIVFADLFIMNLILWVEESLAAISFGNLMSMSPNQILWQIPEQSFFTKPFLGIVIGGILSFGCIFIELFHYEKYLWPSMGSFIYDSSAKIILKAIEWVFMCTELFPDS
ncbi:transmembrane 9 superfamily member 2-like [Marmota marmota marmota]|uniref:transmembrane 9 superfamily member 2-like n=1 Tax=Marmota marmota marmota TaxID=9994 RepID=UPI00209360C1|nr:transmembrane 9 superfamily member 2-like [Marmota marmota marmota]